MNGNFARAVSAIAVLMAWLAGPGLAAAQTTAGTLGFPESLFGVELGDIPGVVWNGTALNGFTGNSCSSAGDVDADGYSDILTGLPLWDNTISNTPNLGQAFLIFGANQSFAGQPDQPLTPFNPNFMVQFIGAGADNLAGYSVSGAGDVNGDGFADFLIGAPGHSANAGIVYLIYGAPRYLWTQRIIALGAASFDPQRMTRIFGGTAGQRAGWSVSGAGDVNGDGFDDILIGIPFGNGGMGEAVVLFGKSGPISPTGDINLKSFPFGPANGIRLLGFRQGSTTGWSVSGVADFNNDGMWEMLIGAPFAAGTDSSGADAAYLIFGSQFAGLTNGIFDLSTISEQTGLRLIHSNEFAIGLGFSVTGLGDFNGDGLGDVAIGAPLDSQGDGSCFIVYGNITNPGGQAATLSVSSLDVDDGGALFTDYTGLRMGFSVAGAGDTNNDGFQDILIGGPGVNPPGTPPINNTPTRAWLVYGQQFLFSDGPFEIDAIDAIGWGQTYTERDHRVLGGLTGFSVAGAGDFNRDQQFDLLIGSPGDQRTYLLFSPFLQTPSGYTIFARNSDTPPLPVGIVGDGSHALPLTRSWIDFNSGNMDPETTMASVYFNTFNFQLFPYLMRIRYSWSVNAFRFGVTDTRFITKGTRTFNAHDWFDMLFWTEGFTEFDWLNPNGQNRDPLRTRISVGLPNGSESFDMGSVPSLSPPRIERAVLVDRNDNGSADSGELLVLIFTRAINYIGFVDQSDFFLPVQGDSLGGANFFTFQNSANMRQLILVLGDGAQMTIPGPFDIANTGAGLPSGIDLIPNPLAPDLVSVFGVPALDNGQPGFNDAGADMRFDFVGVEQIVGPDGGILDLTDSNDAEFTGHQLVIPPGAIPAAGAASPALAADLLFKLNHPSDNLGVVNAVQVFVDLDDFVFDVPAQLKLQFLDEEVDTDNGFSKRDARIYQLINGEWVLVPGEQIVDIENNFVMADVTALNSSYFPTGAAGAEIAGAGQSIGIFGNIFGETVEEASFNIKPSAAGAAALAEIGLLANPVLKSGAGGAYSLHEIEFPGYQIADPADPDRIQVKMRKPTIFDVYTTHGSNEVPGDLSSYFIIETKNASSQSVAFSDPVIFRVQFFDGSKNSYDDRWKFDATAGNAADMKLFTDLRDGDDNEYDLTPNVTPVILPETGGGRVQVLNVFNLTGASGLKLWGAISTDPPAPANEAYGWMLR